MDKCPGCPHQTETEEEKFIASLPDFSQFSPGDLIDRMFVLEEIILGDYPEKDQIKTAIELKRVHKAVENLGDNYKKFTLRWRQEHTIIPGEFPRLMNLENAAVLFRSVGYRLNRQSVDVDDYPTGGDKQ